MADIPASNWNAADASNTDAAPDGAPEGMAPSGVNNVLRAHQGAVKRFWDKINATATTAGTSSAYTLTYSVAPAAYYDGEIISFVVNATNAAAATINVNGLGAKALRLFGGNLLAGALLANDIVTARYSSSAGAFDIIPQNGWVRIGTQNPSASATVDFTSIPAAVNNLMLMFDWKPGTDAVDMYLQTYGADGVLDTGALDYAHASGGATSGSSSGFAGNGSASAMVVNRVGNSIDNGANFGIGGQILFPNIQAAINTKANWQATYADSGGTVLISDFGGGWRAEADRITGLRASFSSGTGTGKFTLYASA